MTTRFEIEQTRAEMNRAVRPSFLDRYDQRRRDEKRRREEVMDRFRAIKYREIEAAVRTYVTRQPHGIGARVLHLSGAEGVVISYEQSKRHAGDPPGGWALVRYPDGSEGACLDTNLVDLAFEVKL